MDRATKDEGKGLLPGSSVALRSSDVSGRPRFPFSILGKVCRPHHRAFQIQPPGGFDTMAKLNKTHVVQRNL